MSEYVVPFLVQFGQTTSVPAACVYEQDDIGLLHLAGSSAPVVAEARNSASGPGTILTKADPDQPDPDVVRALRGRSAVLTAGLVTDVVTVAPDPDVIRFEEAVQAISPRS